MEDEGVGQRKLCQWTTGDDRVFVPASTTRNLLPPASYEISASPNIGIFFEHIPVKTTDLVRFPDSNSNKVIEEIRLFWQSKDVFKRHSMPYKRGIVLYGPPGSGKSCTIQFVMKDVIELGGIVIRFYDPDLFLRGYRMLREIQPETPVVVIMEDIDAILEDYNESSVLNLLDGVDDVQNIVFLATTNYPEKLGPRIINRPSRFDKRFQIGLPSEEARLVYLKHLFEGKGVEESDKMVTKWAKDTEDLSIAHLRELYVAVIILQNPYEEALETLRAMDQESVSSDQDRGSKNLGFKGTITTATAWTRLDHNDMGEEVEF